MKARSNRRPLFPFCFDICTSCDQNPIAGRRHFRQQGPNRGDIVVEGDDILGDGVNVADRLEGLAEPGGICISGMVLEGVRNKVDYQFEDMGEQSLKNITRPVQVFRVRIDGAHAAGSTTISPTETVLALPDKPSIAVLPFENVSGDPEQSYFSDGITEDIITGLSKVSALFVIARNSSFKYRASSVDVKQVSRELGVRYVLEGSVRKAGDRVRVTAQLIDGANAGHLWAERYDGDLSDIFAIQDEVTAKIVTALELKLTTEEKTHLEHRGTDNIEAYDTALMGRMASLRWNGPANARARSLLERAIELDPTYQPVY